MRKVKEVDGFCKSFAQMWKSGEEGLEDLFGFWESESDGEKSGSRNRSKDTSGSSETDRAEDRGERSSAAFCGE